MRRATACCAASSPAGRSSTRASASPLPPSLPRRVKGGLLITTSARGLSTRLPALPVAPICSRVAENEDWVSGAASQSSEPSRMPPTASTPMTRLCSCIWVKPTDGDIAASVAAVR